MKILINFVLFQIAWFACVLGGANGMAWAGPAVVAAVALYHLSRADNPQGELALLAVAAAMGTVFDSALVASGALAYPSGQWHPLMAPYWIIALWVAFATTLNVSLGWLKGRNLLGFLFGALGGPLAYYSGSLLGGVTFNAPVVALTALAVGWGLITPVLVAIAARLEHARPRGRAQIMATATETAR